MKASTGQDIGLDSLIRTVRKCNNTDSPQGSAVSQWSGLLMKFTENKLLMDCFNPSVSLTHIREQITV